jgi:hypothetical protein
MTERCSFAIVARCALEPAAPGTIVTELVASKR